MIPVHDHGRMKGKTKMSNKHTVDNTVSFSFIHAVFNGHRQKLLRQRTGHG